MVPLVILTLKLGSYPREQITGLLSLLVLTPGWFLW